MTAGPDRIELVVAELRRLADLIKSGEIPLPDHASLAWHLDEQTGATVARALECEWRAGEDSQGGGAVAKAVLVPGRWEFTPLIDVTLFVATDEPEQPRRTASERFVRELTSPAEVEQ